jgi:hypothetical protein
LVVSKLQLNPQPADYVNALFPEKWFF